MTTVHSGGGADPAKSLRLLWQGRQKPSRGPKPGLELDDIVTAAVALADREGIDPAVLYRLLTSSMGDSRVLRTRFPVEGISPDHPASRGYEPLFALGLMTKDLDLALELVDHKRADLNTKHVAPWELEHLEALARRLEEERHSPHRLADLAVDGNDLIELGYREGPALGGELARLLDLVVDRPDLNQRDTLLEEARRCLP